MADQDVPTAPIACSSTDESIDISTPAFVAWGSGDTLAEVAFDARRVDSTSNAFFKLRVSVLCKASAPAKTPLFLFIHPERVQSLQLDSSNADQHAYQEDARKKLGSDVVCLRYALKKPADLIGPKAFDLTPKNKASGAVLDSLRSLAGQDTFVVLFPRNVLSQTRLMSLCEAASSGVLKSIARQADLASLYRGKGGQVITQLGTPGGTCSGPSNPPPYNELGPSPPLAPSYAFDDNTSKKRRRRSSSDDVGSGRLDALGIEQMCRKIVEQQKTEMLKVVEEQQSKLYDRLLAELKPYISEELNKLEDRILEHVAERSGKQAEEQDDHLEQRLEDVVDEVNDTIASRIDEVDGKVEDEFYGLRLRLEDFIKEELTEAEERIVEHLEDSASISLQFNR